MLETLRRNPVLQLGGNAAIELKNLRPPASALILLAEAQLAPDDQPVAIVIGPENGAVSEKLVYEAAREAHLQSFKQLIVIGFAIEPNARALVDKVEAQVGIPATYVQATPDLVMGDLLKTMRSSQLFSVTGLPDVAIRKVEPEKKGGPQRYEVELRGLDVFDPTTFETVHRSGDDVPAWLLDTAWNGLSFHVSQAFFPRTGAWDNLRKSLRSELAERRVGLQYRHAHRWAAAVHVAESLHRDYTETALSEEWPPCPRLHRRGPAEGGRRHEFDPPGQAPGVRRREVRTRDRGDDPGRRAAAGSAPRKAASPSYDQPRPATCAGRAALRARPLGLRAAGEGGDVARARIRGRDRSRPRALPGLRNRWTVGRVRQVVASCALAHAAAGALAFARGSNRNRVSRFVSDGA
jgi:hypothetical protein